MHTHAISYTGSARIWNTVEAAQVVADGACDDDDWSYVVKPLSTGFGILISDEDDEMTHKGFEIRIEREVDRKTWISWIGTLRDVAGVEIFEPCVGMDVFGKGVAAYDCSTKKIAFELAVELIDRELMR